VPNNYKFNGIEEQDELGLNVYQAFFRTMDPTIGRWWQIDPKVDNYYSQTPYNAMGNNPVNITDPLGDEWADPKKDQKIADQIAKGVDKANAKLEKQNAKLDSKIEKATAKGKTDKVNTLTAQKNNNTQAIGLNNKTKDHLTYMASKGDNVPKFTFEKVSGEVGGTEIRGDKIVMEVTNSLGNQVHEVSHGFDKSPIGTHDGEEGGEIRAYQAQYSADPPSMPPSVAPGTVSNVNGVTGVYVGGIMDPKTGKPLYPKTNATYKSNYPK
jgi:RHS repeat-associated protein